MKRSFIWFVAFLAAGVSAGAAVLEVGAGKAYAQIQSALDAASENDTIDVGEGIYAETVVVPRNGVTIASHPGDAPRLIGRIDVGGHANVTIRGLEITAWTGESGGVSQAAGTGLTVASCKIHDGSDAGVAAGIFSRGSMRLLVESNEIYRCQKGVNILSSTSSDDSFAGGAIVRDNSIHDNPADGVDLHGEYITVIGNQISNNLDESWVDNQPAGLRAVAAEADGATSVVHCIIANNVIRNQAQNILTEGTVADEDSNCTDIRIYNNVIYNDSGVVNAVSMDALPATHVLIKYSRDVRVYNNTLGRSGGAAIHIQQCADGTIFAMNNVVDNNLGGGLVVDDPLDIATGHLDYNAYFTSQQPITWGDVAYGSCAEFAGATGFEKNGRDGNPFVGPWPNAVPDAESPCVDAGAALPEEFAADFAGTRRPQGGAWDLGAYEMPATSAAVPDTTTTAKVLLSAPTNFRIDTE